MEGRGHVHRVLARHGVHHQQYLVRGDGLADVGYLVHQLFVQLLAAGGIHDQVVVAVGFGVVQGLLRYIHRGDLVPQGEHGHADLLAQDLQLAYGGRTVHVAGGQQRPFVLVFEVEGDLPGGGGLAAALQAGHEDDRGRLGGDVELGLTAAHEGGELLVDDLHHLLAGGEALQHFGAHSPLLDPGAEILGHLIVDVRFQQGHADLAHGGVDVGLGEGAAVPQFAEYIL